MNDISNRKEILACLLAIIVFLEMLACCSIRVFGNETEIMYVNSDNGLRLREKCSTESDILTVLPYGSEINIIKYKEVNETEWAKVEYEDKKGYVVAEYIQEEDPLDGMSLLGNWHITAYTHTGSVCANGNYPSAGYTVACNSLDFGTKIYIEGIGTRVVEDRGPGWLGSAWCDVFMDSYSSCVHWGSQYRNVYLVEGNDD